MFQGVKSWIQQPYTDDMDLTRWALFTGLILVLVILWLMILRDLKEIF